MFSSASSCPALSISLISKSQTFLYRNYLLKSRSLFTSFFRKHWDVERRNQFFTYVGCESTSSSAKRGRNAPRHAQINLRFANKQGAGFNYLSTDWSIDPKTFLLSRDQIRRVNTQFTWLHGPNVDFRDSLSLRAVARNARPAYIANLLFINDGSMSRRNSGDAWQSVFNMPSAILIRYSDLERRDRSLRVISAENPLSAALN